MGIKPEETDGYLVNKERNVGLEWDFLKDLIFGHVNDDQGLATLALAIYGLIIFPQVIEHVERIMIDFFE